MLRQGCCIGLCRLCPVQKHLAPCKMSLEASQRVPIKTWPWLESAKLRKGCLFAIHPSIQEEESPGLCQGELPQGGYFGELGRSRLGAFRCNAMHFTKTILQFRHFVSSFHYWGFPPWIRLCRKHNCKKRLRTPLCQICHQVRTDLTHRQNWKFWNYEDMLALLLM